MKLKVALLTVAIAIGLHIYLALHYYQLNFGLLTSESLCNVNELFNCDNVTASRFSALLGMPIALWGAVTNFILALLIMGWILGWSNDISRHGRYTLWLAGAVAGASVIMGGISTLFIGSYCLFCIGTYLLSFITCALVYKAQEPSHRKPCEYFKELTKDGKTFLYFLIAIPVMTVFFHYSYSSKVGASELEKVVRLSVIDWKAAPTADLSQAVPSFSKGQVGAQMIISEFADFRCVHCKHASPSINAFLASHPNVSLNFYSFPLDGACNESIPGGGDGISCFLAKSVFCAEKIAKKGHAFHDGIFAAQDSINQKDMSFSKDLVSMLVKQHEFSADEQQACIESGDTDTAIRAQAKAGNDAGLKGTPFFLINGRKLNRGQLLPVLEAVSRELNSDIK